MGRDERYFLGGFDRAVRVLDALRVEGRPLRLSDVSRSVQIPPPSAHRILSTLEQLEFVVRDPLTRRYALGPRLLDFGLAVLNSLEPRHVALPYMEELAQRTGETVNLIVMAGARAIIAEIVEGAHTLAVRRRVGHAVSLHAASGAKILLSHLPEEDVKRLLGDAPLTKFTPRTKRSIGQLLHELNTVRRVGYALNDEESVAGVRAVAAPILDARGRVVAALSLVGPTLRVSDKILLSEWPELVLSTSKAISVALGYREEIPGGRVVMG